MAKIAVRPWQILVIGPWKNIVPMTISLQSAWQMFFLNSVLPWQLLTLHVFLYCTLSIFSRVCIYFHVYIIFVLVHVIFITYTIANFIPWQYYVLHIGEFFPWQFSLCFYKYPCARKS